MLGSSNTTCAGFSAAIAQAGEHPDAQAVSWSASVHGEGVAHQAAATGLAAGNGSPLEALLFAGKDLAAVQRYAEASALFGQIIEQDASSAEAHAALLELGIVLKEADEPAAWSLVGRLAGQEGVLRATALGLAAQREARAGRDEAALARLDDLVRDYPNTSAAFYARLNTFYLHLRFDRRAAAAAVLSQVRARSPEEAFTLATAQELRALETGAGTASKQQGDSDQPVAQQGLTQAGEAGALQAEAYPNPFNPTATIRYGLPAAGRVRLAIYDVLGRRVALLVDGAQPAGRHEVRFEAAGLPGGVYLYRLEAAGQMKTGRMLLVK